MIAPTAVPNNQDLAAPPVPESPYVEGKDRKVGELLLRLKEAAVKRRAPFMDTFKETKKFAYDKNFDFLYEANNPDLFFKARLSKAAEFVEIMGSALYPTNPKAAVNSREYATPGLRARHKLEVDYLDYAVYQGDLYTHMRRAISEGLLSGRVVVWTSFNERKNIVQNTFDSVDNFLMDPDARIPDESNWVARRRYKPRWWLAAQHPEKKACIAKLEKTTERPSDAKGSGESASDLIEYWEFYLKVGLANYAPSLGGGDEMNDEELANFQSDEPRKITVAGNEILAVETWEIPFFYADQWPCEWIDIREKPGDLWPASPLETGLGHLRALNWIYSLYISKMRTTTRTPLIVAKYNGQGMSDDEAIKLLKGRDMDIIRVNVNGEILKLGDLVQQFKFESGVDEFERFYGIVSREFEKATGMYEVLYTGTTPTQIRNATTADMIRNSSMSRIEDMRSVLAKGMGRVYAKTLLAARFLHQPEDIAKMFGPQAGMVWGTLAPPEMVAQERQMRQATAMQLQQMGVSPEQIDAQLGPEQLVSLEEWINEASREIVAGSMRPLSPESQVDNLNVALNQLAPSVAGIPGGPEFVSALALEYTRINRYSQELQDAAKKLHAQSSAVTDMQVMMASQPPQPQAPAAKGPQSGPQGGHNQVTG